MWGFLLNPTADKEKSLAAGQAVGRSDLFPSHRGLEESKGLRSSGSCLEAPISLIRSRGPPDADWVPGTTVACPQRKEIDSERLL